MWGKESEIKKVVFSRNSDETRMIDKNIISFGPTMQEEGREDQSENKSTYNSPWINPADSIDM
jgi:hypothetical protein